MSRGKKRIGFELGIRLAYKGKIKLKNKCWFPKGLGSLENCNGTIVYSEFQEDGDHEVWNN